MHTNSLKGIVALIASLAVFVVAPMAQQAQPTNQGQANQSQTQAQPNQTQNQNTNQPQNQPAAQPQKKSFWQKVHDAAQAGQNTINQGQSTVQQGTSTVQQTGQQVQNGVQQTGQQMQNGAQQMQNGAQQGMQNASNTLQSNQASGAFSGGGGGAGACGPSCFDAGPFQANVSQMTMSQEGGWHVIRMNIQFHNSGNQPLTIAYHDGSMVMVDNNGASYVPAGGNPGQLQGMGIDRGAQTDSQFVLGPGQTGSALFSVARGRGPTSPIGTGYAYNFTIDELQAQNGALAIAVRTYNLNFPNLAPGTSNAAFNSSPSKGAVAGGATATAPATGAATGTRPAQSNVQMVSGQQQVVNGRPVQTTSTTQGTPSAVVNNAAMKTPVGAAKTPVSATTQSTAAKPAVATTQTKPSAAAPPPAKKPAPAPSKTATTTTTK